MANGRQHPAPGEVIASVWGGKVWDQSVQTFGSVADRDTQFPAPHDGAIVYLDDSDTFTARRAGAWGPLGAVTVELGPGVDLNSVTAPGVYSQSQTAEATTALNYPIAYAGLLEVFDNPGNTAAPRNMVWQRFTTYAGATYPVWVYVRGYHASGGGWGAWKRADADAIQAGTINFGSVAGGGSASATVTFPKAFPDIPVVTMAPYSTTPHARGVGAASISPTGFTAYFGNWGGSAVTGQAGWMARMPT